MFINAAFIGLTGYSVGKWVFGIRILNEQNRPVGYFSALSREMKVWSGGMAFGINELEAGRILTALSSFSRAL